MATISKRTDSTGKVRYQVKVRLKGYPAQTITKAHAAARAIGPKVLVPDFGGMDTSGRPTDWNDWYRLRLAGRMAA